MTIKQLTRAAMKFFKCKVFEILPKKECVICEGVLYAASSMSGTIHFYEIGEVQNV